jgi:DNA-binding transcriptional LysR family regulator
VFLSEIGSVLQQYDIAMKKTRAAALRCISMIRVEDPITFEPLQKIIGGAMSRFSDVRDRAEITLVSTFGYTAYEAIKEKIVDIAFTYNIPCSNPDDSFGRTSLGNRLLATDTLVVEMSSSHPLADKDVVDFQDLQNVRISVPADAVYDDWRNMLSELFARNGVIPHFDMRVVNSINDYSLLKLDNEVAITPRAYARTRGYIQTVQKDLVGECRRFGIYCIYDLDNPNELVTDLASQMQGAIDQATCDKSPSCVGGVSVMHLP